MIIGKILTTSYIMYLIYICLMLSTTLRWLPFFSSLVTFAECEEEMEKNVFFFSFVRLKSQTCSKWWFFFFLLYRFFCSCLLLPMSLVLHVKGFLLFYCNMLKSYYGQMVLIGQKKIFERFLSVKKNLNF